MEMLKQEQSITKEPVIEDLFSDESSSLKKYQSFFVGHYGIGGLLKYELITMLLGPMPGGLGLFLRKLLYPGLLGKVGSGLTLGRNVTFRHPGKIEIGDRVVIDDDCLVDAKGGGDEGIRIGSDVLIARGSIVQAKTGPICIGDRSSIASQCLLGSVGGIIIGDSVMIAGQCYIGGGRYRVNNREVPMMDQGVYTNGPVVIENDVWIGSNVVVQDGVRIGKGCVVGSGAVVTEDLPEFAIAVPNRKLLLLARGKTIV